MHPLPLAVVLCVALAGTILDACSDRLTIGCLSRAATLGKRARLAKRPCGLLVIAHEGGSITNAARRGNRVSIGMIRTP